MGNWVIWLDIDIPEIFQRVVYLKKETSSMVKVYHNNIEYNVTISNIREIIRPNFIYGDIVMAKNKVIGEIVDIIYHFKNNEPAFYILSNGRKLKTRYFSNELKLIKNTTNNLYDGT